MTLRWANPTRGAPLGLLLLAAAACAETASTPEGPAVVRRDSAGIEIVETHRAVWSEGGAWTLAPQPEVVIGQISGETPYLFGEVRGAVRLDDGSIVVADNQSREVRFFDETGTFVRSVGGAGEGPTEYARSLWELWRCGPDRLYTHDLWGRRILSWSPSGEFQRGFDLVEPINANRGPYKSVCTDEGGFVISGWGLEEGPPPLPSGAEALMFTQNAPVWALDSLGALATDFGSFLSSERIRTRGGSGPHPFGRATVFAGGGGRTYHGGDAGMQISEYDGVDLVRIMRSLTEDLTAGEELVDQYLSADSVDLPDGGMRDRREFVMAEHAMPPELPAYTEMRRSPDGDLWVKRFVAPWESHNRWGVFDADGVFLGNVELPDELTVTEIGNDHVVGFVLDEYDVQRVVVYRLVR